MLARNLDFISDVSLPLRYKGADLDEMLHVDFVVERSLVVQLTSVEVLQPAHCAQMLSCLRLGAFAQGLLINFHVAKLLNGVRRFAA